MGASEQAPVAVVTGGSRGIGHAISHALARDGYSVVVNYARDPDRAQQTVTAIKDAGGSATAVRANLSDTTEIRALFEFVENRHGRLDVLVNNAGFGVMRPAHELPLRHFERTYQLNVQAVLDCSQRAANLMSRGSGGSVVNISSIGSRRVLPNYTAIGVSKAALESLTSYLAVDLAGHGVRVNAVCAGPVDTESLRYFPNAERTLASALEQTPSGTLTTGADVGSAVVFLCSPEARQVRGQTLVVDGGLSLTVHIY